MDPEQRIVVPRMREMLREISQLIGECGARIDESDKGYFGPASTCWSLYNHSSAVPGGLAGLLLQALHPVAMAAVAQHSDYSNDAWRRGMRTSRYGFQIVFGTKREADGASARVRRLHERISGVDPVTGRSYRADDQDLLLWIHCAGVKCALDAYRLLGPGLDNGSADRYVSEMVVAARLVGINPELVPSNVGALEDYLARVRDELMLTPRAADVLAHFTTASMPWTVRPLWLLHLIAAVAVMPDFAGDMFRLPAWLAFAGRRGRALRVAFKALDALYPILPGVRQGRRRIKALSASTQTSAHRYGVDARR